MASKVNKDSHVHFGAGALSIGLVLPVLSRKVRLAVIQQYSSKWESLSPSATEIELNNSEEYKARKFRVIRDSEEADEKQIKEWHKQWLNGNSNFFILTSDRKKYQLFIKDARTLTCSVKEGQSELADLLREIDFATRPTLFPFENDLHKDISSLKNVNVGMVVADRICVDRKIESTKVKVSAEAEGNVVIKASETDYSKLFDGSEKVTVTFKPDDSIFDFYVKRKRYLVNGLHFALATFGYHFLSEMGIPADHWGIQYLPIIQGVLLSKGSEYLSHIENYMDGQIMRLILKDRASIETEYPDLEDDEDRFDILRSFSEDVLHRTNKHLDNLERILDIRSSEKALSLLSKFRQHLNEAKKDIRTRTNQIDELSIRRRPYAADVDFSLEYLTNCVVNITAIANSQKAHH